MGSRGLGLRHCPVITHVPGFRQGTRCWAATDSGIRAVADCWRLAAMFIHRRCAPSEVCCACRMTCCCRHQHVLLSTGVCTPGMHCQQQAGDSHVACSQRQCTTCLVLKLQDLLHMHTYGRVRGHWLQHTVMVFKMCHSVDFALDPVLLQSSLRCATTCAGWVRVKLTVVLLVALTIHKSDVHVWTAVVFLSGRRAAAAASSAARPHNP